jgi:hypothetical protein
VAVRAGCIAVGQARNLTLAERWNGTTWKVQKTLNPDPLSARRAVSAREAIRGLARSGQRNASA